MPNFSKAGMIGAWRHATKGVKERVGKLTDLKQAICL